MRRSSNHPWPFLFHTHTKPFLFLLLVDKLSLCNGLLLLAEAVELFAQVSDALISDCHCLRLIRRRHHRSLVVEEKRLVLCRYGWGRATKRERERGSGGEREREREKVISSQIIPTVQIMMTYLVLCGYGRGRAMEWYQNVILISFKDFWIIFNIASISKVATLSLRRITQSIMCYALWNESH